MYPRGPSDRGFESQSRQRGRWSRFSTGRHSLNWLSCLRAKLLSSTALLAGLCTISRRDGAGYNRWELFRSCPTWICRWPGGIDLTGLDYPPCRKSYVLCGLLDPCDIVVVGHEGFYLLPVNWNWNSPRRLVHNRLESGIP